MNSYLNKMIEYFRSFILTHMHKFLTNQNFPFTQFLALFIQFTFKQPTNENYFRCLDIWNEFIDSISSKMEECRNDTNAQLIKYQEVLLALFVSVSERIQFKTNQSQLEMLDDDILDDDFKTEWQSYLMENINIIVGIGKLFPAQVFQHLFQPFNESLSIYLDLKRFITTTTTSPKLNITAENDCRRLHCSLRDFSTALQIQASLIDHLIGENFEKNFNSGCSLMERLITVADYGSQLKLYDTSSPIENVLEADFIEVHAQTLAVLKTCSVWLAQFYVRSRSSDEGSRSKCDGMIDVLLSSVIPLFLQESVPEKILLSGSHLLLSLLTTVCPAAAYNSNKYLQQLYISGILRRNATSSHTQVELLTYRALTHYLLIPWPTTTNQEWERRGQLMTSFVNHLIGDYVQLGDEETYVKLRLNGEFRESMRPAVEKTLTIVTDIINHLDVSGGKKQKIMSYACFRSSIHLALKLLPVYISNSEVSSLFLQLILAVVQVHRIEMGAQAVASLIQPVMQLFTKELIMDCLTDEKSASHQIVEKFLQILTIIASEPGQTFKKFLPSILDLSLRQVYPLLAERQIPDVKVTLFSLFHSILKHNWKFFFPSTLLAAAAKSSDQLNNQSASFTREQYFSGIMQALGQSFLQTDVELFRHNLSILESLNDRFKLYEKPAFKNILLSDFLSVLLHTLFNKSHDLLRDDITTAIFNMAATDFEYFYSTFVVRFLATVELSSDVQKQRLLIALQREKDLPTFSKNLENFVNDLRYYKLNCCQTPN
ncbi:hypothetical protein HELRODRAFT_111555 [Helobdella robusta]|uniref:Exportin-1 C-terminal domain-containing protein n=1 Tax=Helobdella robusta TaxID=6412 RepID=T1EFC4_HELRO|nr:hypothetical protein HELRODRAFT_111555 [Helobdella robusta]ESO05119.1 hypothetical protein HELRODRAFT_111555 [Helobdella robusta]